jgi:pyruvate dehydrogenase E1 component alpha subunit
VVYVCENNQYAMSFHVRKAFAIERISDRAAAYGMPGITVDGNDVLAVYEAVSNGVKRAREGQGPSLIENVTYRWRGHSRSDANRYRTKEEIASWQEKCPIKRFRKHLLEEGVLTEEDIDRIKEDAYAAIDAAVEFSEASPDPDLKTIEEGVYA